MSQKELQRVKVMEDAAGGRLSVREASRLRHLSERQVRRLKRRYHPIPLIGCITGIWDDPCPGRFHLPRSS